MGAAWRGVRGGTDRFEQVLEIVRQVSSLGMEVCTTLGELGPEEARQLKAAGKQYSLGGYSYGSAEAAADLAIHRSTRALRDTPRWALANAEVHIGVVVPGPGDRAGEAWVVHNLGRGVKWENVLFDNHIQRHFRYPAEAVK